MGGSTSSEVFNYDAQLQADSKIQSNEVKDSKTDNTGPSRIDKSCESVNDLITGPTFDANIKTVYDIFQRGKSINDGNGNCLGTRAYTVTEENTYGTRGAYVWESYNEVWQDSENVGYGLLSLGAKAQDNIGIFSINTAEWVKAQQGIYSQNMRVVSLYATLGKDAAEYITNHAELSVLFCSMQNLRAVLNILPTVSHQVDGGYLKTVIVWDANEKYGNSLDTLTDADIEEAKKFGVELIGFSALLDLGINNKTQVNPPTSDDLAFIMYTSGTTGVPKGAMLSHGNVVTSVGAADGRFHLDENDRHLSYLPLAHIFETAVQCAAYAKGASIGMFQGNIKLLTSDMATLKPTLLCGVPRVFTKFYQKFWAAVGTQSFLKQWIANKGYNAQCKAIRNGEPRVEFYDKKIFKKVGSLADKLGLTECKVIITGAAPCSPYLMEFLKVAFCTNVIQGYGMTETAAIIAVMYPDDNNVGHVGPPCACNEIRLEDVPEMNYGHDNEENPRTGEICVKGANIFKGYYKNDEATAKTIVDGWLHTGDIGRWNNNGTLSIIDRRKNIFKLSQGEYIAAEKIELVYAKAPVIGQVWVYGNSYKSNILCVVAPNAEYVYNHAKSQGWWNDQTEQGNTLATPEFLKEFYNLCTGDKAQDVKNFIFNSMKEQNHHLQGFEKALDIIIEPTLDSMLAGFTEVNQCLTPTFKLRRPYLLNRYVEQLKDAYAKNGQPNGQDEFWPGVKK